MGAAERDLDGRRQAVEPALFTLQWNIVAKSLGGTEQANGVEIGTGVAGIKANFRTGGAKTNPVSRTVRRSRDAHTAIGRIGWVASSRKTRPRRYPGEPRYGHCSVLVRTQRRANSRARVSMSRQGIDPALDPRRRRRRRVRRSTIKTQRFMARFFTSTSGHCRTGLRRRTIHSNDRGLPFVRLHGCPTVPA